MLFRELVSSVASGKQDKSTLAFYIKRIGQEQIVRNLGILAVIGVVVLQTITWLAPPKISEASAASANDIVYGGFTSHADLLARYDQNAELRAVYEGFNIGRDQLANAKWSSVNSNQNVWSAGRYPHGSQNVRLTIAGAATPIYIRPLKVWGAGISYPGLKGTTRDGRTYWILRDCGNPVIDVDSAPPNPGEKTTPQPTPTPLPQTPPPPPSPTPTPLATPTPIETPKPARYSCDLLKAYYDTANTQHNPPLKVTFAVDTTVENTTRQGYVFDFGDGSSATVGAVPTTHTYTEPGKWTASVRLKTPLGTTDISSVCQQTIEVAAGTLSYLKSAANLTLKDASGGPTNAAGTTARPGDEIRYTLTIKNTATAATTGVVFDEDINDILEYADLTDAGGAQRIETPLLNQAASVRHSLRWSALTLGAGQTATKTFIVKVKSPLPTTPRGVSDPGSFDLVMENIFHDNTVKINLQPPTVKQVEIVSKSLPATGPGWANLALAAFASGAVFIALRQRLIKRELEILALHGGR